MLFGEQHSFQESATLMSAAAELGCNFFDSAEMYPVPQRAATSGRSEEFLGRWIKRQNRCLGSCSLTMDTGL
jgi:aryl-alcohol dehydrogenase-like predicted oxidoreductase